MSRARLDEAAIVQMAQKLLYEQAMVTLDGQWIGAVAAIPKQSRKQPVQPELNYGEIFIRDNVPVMAYFLTQGKYEPVRHFLLTCLRLQSQEIQTRGIFPTSFVEQDGHVVADYGQRAIGRVVSVDATLWWVILAYMYVRASGDRDFAGQAIVQSGIQQFLDLILRPSFRKAPTLYVPDGAFMIDRPLDVWGAPLEIQVLLYGALHSAAGLMQIGSESVHSQASNAQDPNQRTKSKSYLFQTPHSVHHCLEYAHRLRQYLLKHYWVTSKTVQVLRRRPTEQYGVEIQNEYNIHTETIPHWLQDWMGPRGGYLIGNIRTGRPDFRFFTLGNCLGAIFDVISVKQQQALFRLVVQNQHDLVAHMPLRICHPPLVEEDWRNKTGYDRKNLPWCYHNAGHWPCLMWFLATAMLRRHHPEDLAIEVRQLLEVSYQLMLRQLPQQKWAEYFDGPTGNWIGQQARINQTWTIVGFLLMHHLLRVNGQDAHLLDVHYDMKL
ncbi:glycoside hydrolase 100 family protein [Alkalinema sp. FACHB-956]|uniref:glycoside hydrolase 100 family protein n=1 Tax=Alkalinema sp. FACHB-956 TaxID=2692768 RepID=UPI001683DA60|nr:glycoside hydrolase 100 family protein [Alkalinema sp. FACHB-956]MBD2329718.1 glycoside hydrolase 100 family protein [Alkalinema sp. FACHB-956]